MKQIDWKIIYSSYEGEAKRAIEFISREAGKNIIRQQGEYLLYVLPCEKEGSKKTKNVFFISCYEESDEIKKFVSPNEVPGDGFLVKVVENPDDSEGRRDCTQFPV